MELRYYWTIIWRRIWLPILLVSCVALVSLLTRQTPSPIYTASLKFNIGVRVENPDLKSNEETYYAWLASEHLVDDLSEVVNSQAFAEDANRHLANIGSAVHLPPGRISGLKIEKRHRILHLNLNWGNPNELVEIGEAIALTLEQDSAKYFAQFGTPNALVTILDKPLGAVPIPPSLTQRLDIPIRLILALVTGLALIFLLDYLDTSIRNAAEIEAMGIPVLAEAPKSKRLGIFF